LKKSFDPVARLVLAPLNNDHVIVFDWPTVEGGVFPVWQDKVSIEFCIPVSGLRYLPTVASCMDVNGCSRLEPVLLQFEEQL
jgi:hypothetical protein